MIALKRKQLKKGIVNLVVVSIVLVIVLVTIFLVMFKYKNTSIDGVFKIENSDDFIMAIKHSSSTQTKFKYLVTKNLEIKVGDLPKNYNFYGNLDGQGNSIHIIADEENKVFSSPLFKLIEKNAEIQRINFCLDDVILCGNTENNYVSLIAETNEGTIKNCSLNIVNVVLNYCLNVSALVNFNYGNIFNVSIIIEKVSADKEINYHNWNSKFGAISTINYGCIKNILLDIVFDILPVFETENDNHYVGYAFAGFPNIEKGEYSNIYIFGGSDANYLYWSKACDIGTDRLSYIQCRKKSYEDIDKNFINKLKQQFDETVENGTASWEFTEQQIPKLKKI